MRSDQTITRREAMRRLGFQFQYELADFFDVTEGAVSQWPADAPLPPLRILQLESRRPDLFRETDIAS